MEQARKGCVYTIPVKCLSVLSLPIVVHRAIRRPMVCSLIRERGEWRGNVFLSRLGPPKPRTASYPQSLYQCQTAQQVEAASYKTISLLENDGECLMKEGKHYTIRSSKYLATSLNQQLRAYATSPQRPVRFGHPSQLLPNRLNAPKTPPPPPGVNDPIPLPCVSLAC